MVLVGCIHGWMPCAIDRFVQAEVGGWSEGHRSVDITRMRNMPKFATLECGHTMRQREHERKMAATAAAHDSNMFTVKMVLSPLGTNPSNCRFAVMHTRLDAKVRFEPDSTDGYTIRLFSFKQGVTVVIRVDRCIMQGWECVASIFHCMHAVHTCRERCLSAFSIPNRHNSKLTT